MSQNLAHFEVINQTSLCRSNQVQIAMWTSACDTEIRGLHAVVSQTEQAL